MNEQWVPQNLSPLFGAPFGPKSGTTICPNCFLLLMPAGKYYSSIGQMRCLTILVRCGHSIKDVLGLRCSALSKPCCCHVWIRSKLKTWCSNHDIDVVLCTWFVWIMVQWIKVNIWCCVWMVQLCNSTEHLQIAMATPAFKQSFAQLPKVHACWDPMSTHHVPNPSPYNGFEKFRLFFVCLCFRDGFSAPNLFPRMAAQIPVPPRWLFLI